MHNYYIGIDNGTSGSIAIIGPDGSHFIKTPVKLEQSYTKKKQNISRVQVHILKKFFRDNTKPNERFAILERAMINPQRFKASMSAMRTLEAEVLILESLKIPFMYCDSKEWQRVLLPRGTKGPESLKKASADIGVRLFPEHEETIRKQKDADGLLIAEWARRENL